MASSDQFRPIIGLDLGTTNSCVTFTNALGELGRVSVATGNAPYDRVLSSIVLDPLADREVGERPVIGLEAEQRREQDPDTTYLEYFKHELDSQRLKQRVPVKRLVRTGQHDFVTETEMVRTKTEWVESGGNYSRAELVAATAAILEHLIQRALGAGADPDSLILVGVPVNYSGYARKRLVCALAKARDDGGRRIFKGFGDVIDRTRFVLEPVAVAAAPGEDLEIDGSENVLIFDHGGGTLDLSLIRYERHPDFARPVPVQELAAGGSDEVAGKHLDQAFIEALRADAGLNKVIEERLPNEITRRQAIERCKRELSTKQEARVPIADILVERGWFEQIISPHLDAIGTEVLRTLERGGVSRSDVGWVVMTGGSSLIPAVQDEVMSMFSELAAKDRVLRYFPDDEDGVEAAITDVAEGLARYGQRDSFQRIVLWDVELGREESAEFVRIFERGQPFERRNGEAEIATTVAAPDIGKPGCSFGVYEFQLDRQFMFGLAEVPELEPGSRLLVKLSRDSLFPVLAIIGPDGHVVRRSQSPTGWEQDIYVAADIRSYRENELEDFFEADAEYVPAVRPDRFEHAPLVRRLRVDDHVDWSAMRVTGGTLKQRSGSGVIERIRPKGTHDSVPEMTSWNVEDFEFSIKTGLGTMKLESCNGCLRLTPKPTPLH